MFKKIETKLRHFSFKIDVDQVGWLYFDHQDKPLNVLSSQALEELSIALDKAIFMHNEGELKGLGLLSGKQKGFIAGADITEFDDLSDPKHLAGYLKKIHALFDRIEKFKCPIVCGIDGFCLGGGLELALACHYRVATSNSSTKLGFPEVKLGIFPGFGGTGRSIRMAGPLAAMQMMLTGRNLNAKAARAKNIVDQIVSHEDQLFWQIRKAILKGKRSRPAGPVKQAPALGPLRKLTADRMREQTAKKVDKNHYPAPFALIDLFEKYGHRPAMMRKHEIKAFVRMMLTDTSHNLRRVFFLNEALKNQAKSLGAAQPSHTYAHKRDPFAHIHVIGAGVMGGDIAAWCVLKGKYVSLQDLDASLIEKARARSKKLFEKRLKDTQKVKTAMARLIADQSGAGIERADVIIEAIVEDLNIKSSVFADIERRSKKTALLATNTSSIPLEDIAQGLKNAHRLIGLHFFNPVAQLPLVEIVRSDVAHDAEIAKGVEFAKAIGKSPLIVKSAPGFLVNRVLAPYLIEAVQRHENGEDKNLLDKAATQFGMPVGPIELVDAVGLDIIANVAQELGLDLSQAKKFNARLKANQLGRKTGQGFYNWVDGKVNRPPNDFMTVPPRLGRQLLKPLVDASEQCVKQAIVADADAADIGVILGTGFAPFLGGPLNARAAGKV